MAWDINSSANDVMEQMRRNNASFLQEEVLAQAKAAAQFIGAAAAKPKKEPAEERYVEMPQELFNAIAILNCQTPATDHKAVKVLASEVFPVSTAFAQEQAMLQLMKKPGKDKGYNF
jgi:hypothetical protein